MKAFSYQIALLEPVLVKSIEGDPNNGVAHPYLPGSVLRGAFIQRFLRERGSKELDLSRDEERNLFISGEVRYLNGYLRLQERRSSPIPLSWRKAKGEVEERFYDFALRKPDRARIESDAYDPSMQWEGDTRGFCSALDKSEVRIEAPSRTLSAHIRRDRSGTPNSESGDIFRYEALSSGQTFEAIILCDDDETARWFEDRPSFDGFIGGSRTGGYGHVSIQPCRSMEIPESGGVESKSWKPASQGDGSSRWIVTLLSDLLIRDENGQFAANEAAFVAALAERLKLKADSLRLVEAFFQGVIVGGFNRKWGLPLPQGLGFRMGSVFILDAQVACAEKIRQLTWEGMGERRAEGFGRIALNAHRGFERIQDDAEKKEDEPVSETSAVVLSLGEDLAQKMTDRLLQRRVDEILLERTVATELKSKTSDPEMTDRLLRGSQLKRMQAIIEDELMKSEPKITRVEGFLKSIEDRSSARKQWERVEILDPAVNLKFTPLIEWIESQLGSVSQKRTIFDDAMSETIKIGSKSPSADETLRVKCVLRYLNAVFAQGAKRIKQRDSGRKTQHDSEGSR